MASMRATILRLVGDIVRDEIRRSVRAVAMWILAFILILLALGFAIGGIYSAIAGPLGPVAASFIVAGGALILALLLIMAVSMSFSRGHSIRREAIDEFKEDHPRASGVGDIVGAFGIGLVQGLAKRRKR